MGDRAMVVFWAVWGILVCGLAVYAFTVSLPNFMLEAALIILGD